MSKWNELPPLTLASALQTFAPIATTVTLDGVQTLTNKTLTTPTIASLTNAQHSHQNAAGGGSLDAAALGSGTLNNARVNWAAPSAYGSGTPAAVSATTLGATGLASLLAGLLAKVTDAAPAANTDVLTLDHDLASGGGSNNIAAGLLFRARSSVQLRETGRIRGALPTSTDASRIGNLIFTVYNIGTPVDVLTLTPTQATMKSPLLLSDASGGTTTALIISNWEANNASKSANITGLHYNNSAEEPTLLVGLSNTSTTNIVRFGGGISSANAATQIDFYTAANNITTTGTLRLSILSDGTLQLVDTNMQVGTTTGTKIGTATSQKIGFWNATPVIQPAAAAQAAVDTTAATQTTPWGFSTQAQADGIITLLNEIRRVLVLEGLMKGAA